MHIRTATEKDITSIRWLLDEQNVFHSELLPAFFRVSPTEESRVRKVLEEADADFLIAEEEGELLGLAELHRKATKDLPILVQKAYVYIQELIVAEGHQGRGIGTEMMEAIRTWARERGAPSLRTSVVPSNDRARAFYARHGFVDTMVSIEADV